MKAAVLAGVQSGCGKTTIMMALLQYLKSRSDAVTSFKAGPDFLDPLWHQAVTGRASYNLDTRMMGEAACRQQFTAQVDAEFALIEGVMGMFDGQAGVGGPGSAADLSRVLDVPVWLVIDARGMSGSIVALARGFVAEAQQMGVTITAIVANRVGSERHAAILRDLLIEHELPPLLAWMDKLAPVMPERHLGLKRPDDVDIVPDFSANFHVDEELLGASWSEPVVFTDKPVSQASAGNLLAGRCIAIARDAVCCFIYQANLDWLLEQGASIRYFSLLDGESVSSDADAMWLPGGYPELYGAALSQSDSWSSIREFVASGKPVLAECGGMMLLGETLVDSEQKVWPMAAILPISSRMQGKLAALGYRENSEGVRGHEFHHSVREADEVLSPAFEVKRGDGGVRQQNLRASYIHWYFSSAADVVAAWFGGAAQTNDQDKAPCLAAAGGISG